MVILKKVKTKERWSLGFQRKERRWQENNPDTLEGEEKVRQRPVKTERERGEIEKEIEKERETERKKEIEKERDTERKKERQKEKKRERKRERKKERE